MPTACVLFCVASVIPLDVEPTPEINIVSPVASSETCEEVAVAFVPEAVMLEIEAGALLVTTGIDKSTVW